VGTQSAQRQSSLVDEQDRRVSPGSVEKENSELGLLRFVEAVTQIFVAEPGRDCRGSVVGDGLAVGGGVTADGVVLGAHGGYLVAVGLGEVVGHHQ
jgi:hypothetical protein